MPAPLVVLAGVVAVGWAADKIFNKGRVTDRVVDTVTQRMGIIPQLQDEVVVEVKGEPGVTKQQLYFLALAAANGIVRRFGNLYDLTSPAYGSIAIEYDAADHWVRASITYNWSMAAVMADTLTGPTVATQFNRMAVYRGPQCDVNGGTFDFLATGGAVPANVGIPTSAVSPQAPVLPFAGQPILTACPTTPEPRPTPITQDPVPSAPLAVSGPRIPSPNPKPPGDNRSRGTVIVPSGVPDAEPVPGPIPTAHNAKCCDKLRALLPLVFSALTAPGSNAQMYWPTPQGGPTGT